MAGNRQLDDNDSTSRRQGRAGGADTAGAVAEGLAARFLERQGLQVLARNYRCRGGEVDLICRHGQDLVFVEVRLRRNSTYGGAAASITSAKRQRIVLAAQHYLASRAPGDSNSRFDCVLLDDLSASAIEWIRHAFDAA